MRFIGPPTPGYDGFIYPLDTISNPPTPPHYHPEWEMNLVVEGSVLYQIAGKRQKLTAGCMLWLAPYIPHHSIDHSPDCRAIVVMFRQKAIQQIRFRSPQWDDMRRAGFRVRTVRPVDTAFLLDAVRRIMEPEPDCHQDNARCWWHFDPALLNSGLHFLLTTGWRAFLHGGEFQNSSVHPGVLRAIEKLQEEERDALSLESLASQCGLSPSHLSCLFHKQTGVKLNEFRNKIRLNRFLALYGDGSKHTIMEACFEAGFGSYAQFAHLFTRHFGCSPRTHARKLQLQKTSHPESGKSSKMKFPAAENNYRLR